MKKFIFLLIFFMNLYGLGYAQTIFFEGFESATFPPTGWTRLKPSGVQTWERYTIDPPIGSGAAWHEYSASTQETTALVSPQIEIPNYGNPTLEFWSRIQFQDYRYSGVWVSTTDNSSLNSFTEIKVLSGNEIGYNWQKITIPLTDFLGQNIYIAFKYDGYNGHRWFIDNISIIHFESFTDMEAVSVTPEAGEYSYLSNSVPVTVKLKNNGGNAASGFGLKLVHNGNEVVTETFTGSISSFGEATYTFNTTLNLMAMGTHTIQVTALLPGDQAPSNDMVSTTLTNLGCTPVTNFPFIEGFENQGNNIPPCWTQVHGYHEWHVFSASDAQPGIFPKEAFAGNRKAVFFTPATDFVATLITPPLDLSALSNPVLKFHHIQKRDDNYRDSLKVYYKSTATDAWVLLEKYTTAIEEWTEHVIPLPNPSNQYFIGFKGYGEWGFSVQLDEISIDDFFESDIEVTAIAPEGVHMDLSAQQTVTATIKNNGRNPVTGFNLSLYLNGTLMATEPFTDTIQGLNTYSYSFNTKVDISISGTYEITVVANMEGDEVAENNELTVVVKNLVCNALTFPYDEGFEETVFPPYCWINKGTQWDRLDYSVHSGYGRARHKWWDTKAQDGWLISPKFSIPVGGDFMLEFWSHVYEKRFFTYSGVWISTTDTELASFTEVKELSLNDDETPDNVWVRLEVPLNTYEGKDIYIAFRYKNSGGESGHIWSLDDIKVFNLSMHIDAEIVAITTPPELCMNLTNQEAVTVRIKNNGGENISGFKLILECNGTVVATENYIGYIPSLAYANYTFTKKLDLSEAGTYTLKATIVLNDDMVPENNSQTKIIENRVCPIVTNLPWHGEFQGDAAGQIANCWINIDKDGDTQKWRLLESNGDYYAFSESYDAAYEFPLSPDNWLLTPPLALSSNAYLSFKVGSANSEAIGAEKYSVLVSTTGISTDNFTAVRTEQLYPSDYTEMLIGMLSGYGVKTVKVPLSAYIGKTIHIAFRHWDCTDQDRLIITDINVVDDIPVTEHSDIQNPLKAWINNDKLYVGGLIVGENWEMYSILGSLIYRNVANSEVASVTLNNRGVYIVRSGSRVIKMVY